MHMKAAVVLVLALSAARLEAAPRCAGTTQQSLRVASGSRFDLPISPVPTATDYEVQRSASWTIVAGDIWIPRGELMTTTLRSGSTAPQLSDTLFNTSLAESALYYTITASRGSGPTFEPCTQDVLVSVAPDAALARDATRIVVPVVGSLRGANNSIYRTRLLLHNVTNIAIEGTIVFRATQSQTSSSIRYALAPGATRMFDDVVVAAGGSGLGSLDIVPDATEFGYLAPEVTVELESLLATSGAFGTEVPAVTLTDATFGALHTSFDGPTFLIRDLASKRHSVGIRTLADEVTVTAIVRAVDGRERATIERTFPADFHIQQPLAAFLGLEVTAGERIDFLMRRRGFLPLGGAIVYLAATDNVTNDVRLEVPRPTRTRLEQPILACSSGRGCTLLGRR